MTFTRPLYYNGLEWQRQVWLQTWYRTVAECRPPVPNEVTLQHGSIY